MKYQSYEILQEFGDELVKKGFDNLSLKPGKEDRSKFYELFESWISRFKDGIQSDLRKVFGEGIVLNIEKYSFDPMDVSAQGATLIHMKIKGIINEDIFFVYIKYLVFNNRIMIFLDSNTEINVIRNRKLRKKLFAIGKTSKEGYHVPIELKEIN